MIQAWADAVGKPKEEMDAFWSLLDKQIVRMAMFGHGGAVGPAVVEGDPCIDEFAERQKQLLWMFNSELIATQNQNPWDAHGNPVAYAEAAVFMAQNIADGELAKQKATGEAIKSMFLDDASRKLENCLVECVPMPDDIGSSSSSNNDSGEANTDASIGAASLPVCVQIVAYNGTKYRTENAYEQEKKHTASIIVDFVRRNANPKLQTNNNRHILVARVNSEFITWLLNVDRDDALAAYQKRVTEQVKVKVGSVNFNVFMGAKTTTESNLQLVIGLLSNLRPANDADKADFINDMARRVQDGLANVSAPITGSMEDKAENQLANPTPIAPQNAALAPLYPSTQSDRNSYDEPANMEDLAVATMTHTMSDLIRLYRTRTALLGEPEQITQEALRSRATSAILDTLLSVGVAGTGAVLVQAAYGALGLHKQFDDASKVIDNQGKALAALKDTELRSILRNIGEQKSLKELAAAKSSIQQVKSLLFNKEIITSPSKLATAMEPISSLMNEQQQILTQGMDNTISRYTQLVHKYANATGDTAALRDEVLAITIDLVEKVHSLRRVTSTLNQGVAGVIKWFLDREKIIHEVLDASLLHVDDAYRSGVMEQVHILLLSIGRIGEARELIAEGLTDAIVVLQNSISSEAGAAGIMLDSWLGRNGQARHFVGMLIEPLLRQFMVPLDMIRFARMLQKLRTAQLNLLDAATVKNAFTTESLPPGAPLALKAAMENATVVYGASWPRQFHVRLTDRNDATYELAMPSMPLINATNNNAIDSDGLLEAAGKSVAQIMRWVKEGAFRRAGSDMQLEFRFDEAKNVAVDVSAQVHAVNGLIAQVGTAWNATVGAAARRTLDLVLSPGFVPTPGTRAIVQLVASQLFMIARSLGMSLWSVIGACKRQLLTAQGPMSTLNALLEQHETMIINTANQLQRGQELFRRVDVLDVFLSQQFDQANQTAANTIKNIINTTLDADPSQPIDPSTRFLAAARAVQQQSGHARTLSDRSIWQAWRDSRLSHVNYFLSDALASYALLSCQCATYAFLAPDLTLPYLGHIGGSVSEELTRGVWTSAMLGGAIIATVVPSFDRLVAVAMDRALHQQGDLSDLSEAESNRYAIMRSAVRMRRRMSWIDGAAATFSRMAGFASGASAFTLCSALMLMQPIQAHDIVGYTLASLTIDGAVSVFRFSVTNVPGIRQSVQALRRMSWVTDSLMAIPVILAPAMGGVSVAASKFFVKWASRFILGRIASSMFIGMEDYTEAVALVRTTAAVTGQLVIVGAAWNTIRDWMINVRRSNERLAAYAEHANTISSTKKSKQASKQQAGAPPTPAPNSQAIQRTLALAEQADSLTWLMFNASLLDDSILNTPKLWLASVLVLFRQLFIPLMVALVFHSYM